MKQCLNCAKIACVNRDLNREENCDNKITFLTLALNEIDKKLIPREKIKK